MPAAGRPAKPKAKPTKSTKEEPNKENSTDKAASKAEQQARTYALQELGKERRRRAFVGMLKWVHGAAGQHKRACTVGTTARLHANQVLAISLLLAAWAVWGRGCMAADAWTLVVCLALNRNSVGALKL